MQLQAQHLRPGKSLSSYNICPIYNYTFCVSAEWFYSNLKVSLALLFSLLIFKIKQQVLVKS